MSIARASNRALKRRQGKRTGGVEFDLLLEHCTAADTLAGCLIGTTEGPTILMAIVRAGCFAAVSGPMQRTDLIRRLFRTALTSMAQTFAAPKRASNEGCD